ncbi:MAG: choice-of-anchor L domain-containing protein, partial [Bacteroidota bacterium]
MNTSSLKPKMRRLMMNKGLLLSLLCLFGSVSSLFAQQPISLAADPSVAEVAAALDGPQARISNVTLNCPQGAYALFDGDATDLGQNLGVLLTTGSALNAIGPNVDPSLGNDPVPETFPGDADLDALSVLFGENASSLDACVIEMDVVSETDELVFDYTFGSDEYPEFANNPDRFNDIFALLISGPGITGDPGLNGQQNIAVLPNAAETVVQIDSVNGSFNSAFFRDNTNGLSLEYDGLTTAGGGVALQARAAVQACATYHLKLAIADRGDELFDSGVFVSAVCGGFPDLGLGLASGVDYLLEGCSLTPDSLIINYENEKATPQTYGVTVGGSATLGTDYSLPGLGTEVIFTPGVNRIAIPIIVVEDAIDETEETIELSFTLDSGCGPTSTVSSLNIRLRDGLDLDVVNVGAGNEIFYCAGGAISLTASGADAYNWDVTNAQVDGGGETVTITPTDDGVLTLTGTVGSCSEDLVYDLLASNATVEIANPDTINICLGDTVLLEQTNNVNDQNLTWRPAMDFLDPVTTPNPRVVPSVSRYYAVSVGPEGGCAAQDSVYIDVDRFVVPELISDTVHCGSTPLQLIVDRIEDVGNTVYDWSPGDLLNDSTDVNSVLLISGLADTLFTLVSSAANGACTDTQTVRIEVTLSSLELNGGADTVFRCNTDGPFELTAATMPGGGANISWRPTTGAQSPPTGQSYMVDPPGNVTYYAEAIINGCPQIDSVAVRTDSLPVDLSFTVDPVKDPYCQGDTFTIQSPTYDVGDFPLITHEWAVAPGLASPDDLYNAVVFASDSALFTRVTVNGACRDSIFEQINVVTPPTLIFEPADPVVCPGEELQINVSFDPSGPSGTLEWEDPNGTLSCTDCLDPIATVQQNTMYTIEVTAEGSDCTSPSMYAIATQEDIPPILNPNTLLCPGDSRRVITGDIVPRYTYRITGGGIDSTDPNVEVTPTATTTYTIETTGDCGTESQTLTLNIAEDYTVTVSGPTLICSPDDPITLTAMIDQNRAGRFDWIGPGGFTATGAQVTVDAPVVAGTYTATFFDDLGCGSAMEALTVEILTQDVRPEVVITSINGVAPAPGATIESLAEGSMVTFAVVGIPDGLNVTYAWAGNYTPAGGDGSEITVTLPTGQDSYPALNYTVTVSTV